MTRRRFVGWLGSAVVAPIGALVPAPPPVSLSLIARWKRHWMPVSLFPPSRVRMLKTRATGPSTQALYESGLLSAERVLRAADWPEPPA